VCITALERITGVMGSEESPVSSRFAQGVGDQNLLFGNNLSGWQPLDDSKAERNRIEIRKNPVRKIRSARDEKTGYESTPENIENILLNASTLP
jgi:hypothetical protein